MENATRALEIAAGVLLAVLIMSLIAYFFSSMSLWPQEEDSMETAEQLAKFNLEYEVYAKKAMYGADVISCLAKAQSNNEKYVEGANFLAGNKYGEKYWINVYVNIKSHLEESLEIYYFDENTSGYDKQKMVPEWNHANASNAPECYSFTMGNDGTNPGIGFVFNRKDGKIYSSFSEGTKLETIHVELSDATTLGMEPLGIMGTADISDPSNPSTYKNSLFTGNSLTPATPLQTLVSFTSTNMKQTIMNNTGKDLEKWSTAVWTSALYDFKTRRFRCDEIKYSDNTGRVNAIFFTEI